MTGPTTSCDAVRAALPAYYDADTDRAPLDAHIATCSDCRARFDALQTQLREMACREFVELATDYLEGELDPALSARIERHLQLCQGCREFLDEIRRTVELLGRLR